MSGFPDSVDLLRIDWFSARKLLTPQETDQYGKKLNGLLLTRTCATDVIDFRARPNTTEYLTPYAGHKRVGLWRRFGVEAPKPGSLSEFVRSLDSVGVKRAVFTGRQEVRLGSVVSGVTNDYVAACVAEFPDRLVGFAGLDSTSRPSENLTELRRSIEELGLSGVSVDLPDIKPDNRRLYPVYAMAEEMGVPMVVTMGPLVGPKATPSAVDRVAVDFPDLLLVLSHGCWPQTNEFVALAYRRDNVYLEASIYEFFPGAQAFVEAANSIIQDKVVYASAFPFNPLETIERFRTLPFDPQVLQKLIHDNAARLLGVVRDAPLRDDH